MHFPTCSNKYGGKVALHGWGKNSFAKPVSRTYLLDIVCDELGDEREQHVAELLVSLRRPASTGTTLVKQTA
jgi:hypothetical protein